MSSAGITPTCRWIFTPVRRFADLAVAEQGLLVIDMSAFDSKAEQNRFVLEFMTRLYHRNREPLHLVLEEADEFAPERNFQATPRCSARCNESSGAVGPAESASP